MLPLDHIMIPAIVLLISTSFCLAWLYLSSQSTTPRSLHTSLLIVARLIATVVLPYVILCTWLGLPEMVFAGCAAFVLLVSLVATHQGFQAGHVFEFALVNAIGLPIYALKQFVLGFPDRDILILSPPSDITPPSDLSRLNHATGTVLATLRPCGTVEIEGVVYNAASADGKYLDMGAEIRVTGIRNLLLIVIATKTFDMQQT